MGLGTGITDELLSYHGDAEPLDGVVDLAVNVRTAPMPDWLAKPIAATLTDLARYPDSTEAREALAARHGRTADEVLVTAGAAQAFTLIAHAYAHARHPLVVHPQFTEPDVALIAAGVRPDRHILVEHTGFAFDPASVPVDADLVMIGNPTNPTSVVHPAEAIASLARSGRLLVVDEAFADTVPGETASLSRRRDLPGLVVIRSLTKTWGLAGLRIGYMLAGRDVIDRLAAQQSRWPVSAPALAAAVACASPDAVRAEEQIAGQIAAEREHLVRLLAGVPGVTLAAPPASSFVLFRVDGGDRVRARLRERGFVVRRGDSFPGLGADWLRAAVRETLVSDAFIAALRDSLEGGR